MEEMRDQGWEVIGAFLPQRWGHEWPLYGSTLAARTASARTAQGEWKMRRVWEAGGAKVSLVTSPTTKAA